MRMNWKILILLLMCCGKLPVVGQRAPLTLLTHSKCWQVFIVATYSNEKWYDFCHCTCISRWRNSWNRYLPWFEQGLCHTADKLLMIIHEFCSIYLKCEHVHESHSLTVFSTTQLLYELHQIMDRKERETVSEFLSQNPSILVMLFLAVSRHRKCKLQLPCLWKCCYSLFCYGASKEQYYEEHQMPFNPGVTNIGQVLFA